MFKKILFLCLFPAYLVAPPAYNVALAKKAVLDFHHSGAFAQECKKIVRDAIDHLKTHEHTFGSGKTVVFDIDDTFLSNLEHIQRIDFCTHCGSYQAYVEWVQQAKQNLIPHIKELYDYCVQQNYRIVFLSARPDECYAATIKNLALHGCTQFHCMILRTEQEAPSSSAINKLKHRTQLTQEGCEIVACVGDQESDFYGGLTGHCIKIPNYLYTFSSNHVNTPTNQ